MSDFIHGFMVVDGQVLLTPSSPALPVYHGGKRMDSETGTCYAEEGATVAVYQNSLPFGGDDQLAITDGGTPAFFAAGFAFTSANRLCVDSTNTADFFQGGLPFTAAGRLCVTIASAPSGDRRVTSGGDPRVTDGGDQRVLV